MPKIISFFSLTLTFTLTLILYSQEKKESREEKKSAKEMVELDPDIANIIFDHDKNENFKENASRSLVVIVVKEKVENFVDPQFVPEKKGMGIALKKKDQKIFITSMLLIMNADSITIHTLLGNSCSAEVLFTSDDPPLSAIICKGKTNHKEIVPVKLAEKSEADKISTVFSVLIDIPDKKMLEWGKLTKFETAPLAEYFVSTFGQQFGAPVFNKGMKLLGITFRYINEKEKKTLVAPFNLIEKFIDSF